MRLSKTVIEKHINISRATIVVQVTVVASVVILTLGTSRATDRSESCPSWTQTSSLVEHPTVIPGIDVLRETGDKALRGKRLGLVTNHTGKAIDGTPTWRVLRDELGLRLVALFSPEHGFGGQAVAGDAVASSRHAPSGLPLFSLYGNTRRPTPEMIRGIDTLLFDIQDIGVRFYTYISTLKLCMEASAAAGIEVVVLDRPNPNSGVRVEGPVLDTRFQSFVGAAPVALVHGLTLGEFALFLNGEGMLDGGLPVALRVIPARKWKRSAWWEDTKLPWRPTSPNIRTAETSLAYPALGLFEGTNVSEGRGTGETFLLVGAPWIREEILTATLEKLALPGVRFFSEVFTPKAVPEAPRPIYQGEQCRGFRLKITDRDRFQAVRTGLTALATIRDLYPEHFEWRRSGGVYYLDRLLGTDGPRRRLEAGDSVDVIVTSWEKSLERFRRRRARYLLYPE